MKYRRWSFYFALLVMLAATAGPSLYFGHREQFQAKAIEAAVARLAHIPTHFGPWHLRAEEDLDESALRMLQCAGHVNRTYTNKETGESVALTVLVGPPGPLVAHTPEICLTSREFVPLQAAEPMALSGRPNDRFFAAPFRATTLEGQKLNVYFGWSRDGKTWEAPDSPRMTLGPLPVLYKIQVSSLGSSRHDDSAQTSALRFLVDLLPIIAEESPKNVLASDT